MILLKKFINEQNLKNRKMITKQLRLKKDTENTLKLMEEAKIANPEVPKPKEAAAKEPDMMEEFKSLVTGSAFIQPSAAKKGKLAMSGALAAKNKTELSICSCGNLNPMHRGYCTDCVKKLKAKYD